MFWQNAFFKVVRCDSASICELLSSPGHWTSIITWSKLRTSFDTLSLNLQRLLSIQRRAMTVVIYLLCCVLATWVVVFTQVITQSVIWLQLVHLLFMFNLIYNSFCSLRASISWKLRSLIMWVWSCQIVWVKSFCS